MADGAPAPGPGGGIDVNKLKGQLGMPGLIVVGSAALGLVACMLPWYSWSTASAFGGMGSGSWNGFNTWHGSMSFLLEIAAAGIAILIAMGKAGPNEKNMCFGLLGAGGLVVVASIMYMLATSGGADFEVKGFAKSTSGKSLGVFLNLIAGGGIAFGGFLLTKAKGHLGK